MISFALIIYLLIITVIAIYSYRSVNTVSDFFVAQKKGSLLAVTGSLIATILGGSAIVGAVDAGNSMGWSSSWFMLCASIGLFALIPLTQKISKLGRFTLPDLLEDLYGTNAKKIASLVIPIAWLGIIAAQVIASARILQSFTSINYMYGVILSGTLFTFYTIAGGQISILKTDFIQTILIITGLILLFVFSLKNSKYIPFETLKTEFPFHEKFRFTDLIILIITYSTTFTAGPDIYSRIFCASSPKIAKKSILITALTLIPIAFIIGYLSVYGTILPASAANGSVLINISNTVLPNWLSPLIALALLSAVLSSADTTILSSSIIISDFFGKNATQLHKLKTSRLIILIIGIASIIIALKFTSIIGMLLIALSVYAGAFVIPIIAGLIGLKVKDNIVETAIIAGGIIALIGKLLQHSAYNSFSKPVIVLAFIINAAIMFWGRTKK